MFRPLLAATLALAPLLASPASGQSAGTAPSYGGGSGQLSAVAACQPGNITCYATLDAHCRSNGEVLTMGLNRESEHVMGCSHLRRDVLGRYGREPVQGARCSAGHLCRISGPRTGLEASVYAGMVGLQNSCHRSGGRFVLNAIVADGPNSATLYAACARRS